jgi:ribA/ribD-fused uncharacterized protein
MVSEPERKTRCRYGRVAMRETANLVYGGSNPSIDSNFKKKDIMKTTTRDVFGNKTIYFTKEDAEYGFLSNFHPAPFVLDGIYYPTSEHAYQAHKTNNVGTRLKISKISTPAGVKIYVSDKILIDKSRWNECKNTVMYTVLKEKFLQNEKLFKELLNTGHDTLVEYTTWNDRYWGVGEDFKGMNHLGLILMVVREELLSMLEAEYRRAT